MRETEKDDLRRRLDDLSRRLESRVRDFTEKGAFSDLHRRSATELRQRQAELVKRIDAAAHAGTAWEMTKAELARDFASLFDDFTQFEQALEAARMKKR